MLGYVFGYTYESNFYISPWIFVFIAIIITMIVARKINIKRLKDPSRVKITSLRGKLIRKKIDRQDELRNVRNLIRFRYAVSKLEEESLKRYYITFETEKGIKSFTVLKEVYKKVKLNQKGIIKIDRKKFISFNKGNIFY